MDSALDAAAKLLKETMEEISPTDSHMALSYFPQPETTRVKRKTKPKPEGVPKYTGVSWSPYIGKWTVTIGRKGRSVNCGYYEDAAEAAMISDWLSYHIPRGNTGRPTRWNFPNRIAERESPTPPSGLALEYAILYLRKFGIVYDPNPPRAANDPPTDQQQEYDPTLLRFNPYF